MRGIMKKLKMRSKRAICLKKRKEKGRVVKRAILRVYTGRVQVLMRGGQGRGKREGGVGL
jgi:hypothetical protein